MHACQLNSWAVYNWEREEEMTQKEFIVDVAKGLLAEDPEHDVLTDFIPPTVLSPAAQITTQAMRFHCSREQVASIARSQKYK